jgi:hypothetical protein
LFFAVYFFSWDVVYVSALSSSRGRGKMIVEFFSAAISVSVPRNLSWRAWGFVEMISAACRQNLPVPSLMRGYMYAFGYQNLGATYDLVQKLDLPQDPCGSCATCAVRCVKGIDVAERVRDVARLRSLPSGLFA